MKPLIFITTLMLTACDKTPPPACTAANATHRFLKWKDTGGKSGAYTAWMKRECEECGWQEERGARTP